MRSPAAVFSSAKRARAVLAGVSGVKDNGGVSFRSYTQVKNFLWGTPSAISNTPDDEYITLTLNKSVLPIGDLSLISSAPWSAKLLM
jgi:hypothetical protein